MNFVYMDAKWIGWTAVEGVCVCNIITNRRTFGVCRPRTSILGHQTDDFEYLGLSPSHPIPHRIMAAEEIRAQSYVGFDSITQQIEHKLLKRGFQFNVIVVGEFLYAITFGWPTSV